MEKRKYKSRRTSDYLFITGTAILIFFILMGFFIYFYDVPNGNYVEEFSSVGKD